MSEQIKRIKIGKVIPNEMNPRYIKDDKFRELVKSIQDFPEMLDIRPIIIDEDMIVLGGNMRLKACNEAGLKEVPTLMVKGWTEEKKKEFVIKDNIGFGKWDWDIIASTYDSVQLEEWGLEVEIIADVDLGNFFERDEHDKRRNTIKIVFEFSEDNHRKVDDALNILGSDREAILMSLLKVK